MTVAELAYQVGMGKSNEEDRSSHRMWLTAGQCLGWGWLFPPDTFEWAVHPGSPQLLDEILDWCEAQAGGQAALRTAIRDGDRQALETLHARGFVRDFERPWVRLNHRTLVDIEESQLPSGYRLRTVSDYDGDITKRVIVHQRSWAEIGTRVGLHTYPGVMTTWPYRSDLDFVLEADDGTPVAFALGWYDEANRVGEFEPLGTDPAYRKMGLGRALLLLALKRFRDVGATSALVASRGDDGQPLPRRLYESVGFRELSRQLPFVKPPSGSG